MKTLFLIPAIAVAAIAQAAPSISVNEISTDSLKQIASEQQKASIERGEKARAEAEHKRDEAGKEAKEATNRNDDGMKQTIRKRHLNTMLPPCEREPEAPRDPSNYELRF